MTPSTLINNTPYMALFYIELLGYVSRLHFINVVELLYFKNNRLVKHRPWNSRSPKIALTWNRSFSLPASPNHVLRILKRSSPVKMTRINARSVVALMKCVFSDRNRSSFNSQRHPMRSGVGVVEPEMTIAIPGNNTSPHPASSKFSILVERSIFINELLKSKYILLKYHFQKMLTPLTLIRQFNLTPV